ncbi:serine palmitoyltransferase small subunit A [Musca vetustissima]|uniref:serine palmitoyltransferase small subunit A n=1 Tax=Musca vetustissima TaxID=27455 RepID=UPI002AB7A94B|nr:serine palmitoyltransferase small subunit A [Musca vetustissima]
MFHKLKDSFHRFIRYIKWLHMLYELNTYLSMCEPWEKVFLNCLFATTLGVILYSTYVYIPGYIFTIVKYITPAVYDSSGSSTSPLALSEPLIAKELEL